MKMPADVATDVPSESSLSFAGYLSIQNKYSMPQKAYAHAQPPAHDKKTSPDFEFSKVTPKRHSSADVSNGKLLHQTNNGRSVITEPIPERSTTKPNAGIKNGTDKKRASPGLSQKIFNSFACRDCRAIEPTHSVVVERASR